MPRVVLKRKVDQMAEKGGYIGVINKNKLLTIYRANSYNHKKAKKLYKVNDLGEVL